MGGVAALLKTLSRVPVFIGSGGGQMGRVEVDSTAGLPRIHLRTYGVIIIISFRRCVKTLSRPLILNHLTHAKPV
jgi:hypothetical protein